MKYEEFVNKLSEAYKNVLKNQDIDEDIGTIELQKLSEQLSKKDIINLILYITNLNLNEVILKFNDEIVTNFDLIKSLLNIIELKKETLDINIINSLINDEKLIPLLSKYEVGYMITLLDTDQNKIDCLNNDKIISFLDDHSISTIIRSLTDDKNKTDALNNEKLLDLLDEYSIITIINSLTNHKNRIDILNNERIINLMSAHSVFRIITSITNDQDKIALFNNDKIISLLDKYAIFDIIISLTDDKNKIDMLNNEKLINLIDERSIRDIINSFKDDKNKIDVLNDEKLTNLLGTYTIFDIIINLSNDQSKIDFLNDNKMLGLIDNSHIPDIIRSLTDDKNKIDMLNNEKLVSLMSEYLISKIITSLTNDQNKIDFLNRNKMTGFESFIPDIICSLTDDKNKIDILNNEKMINLLNERSIFNIIISLTNNQNKIKALNDKKLIPDLSSYNLVEIIVNLNNISDINLAFNTFIDQIKLEEVIQYLEHNEIDKKIYNLLFYFIKDKAIAQYNINEENLSYIINIFGYNIITYLKYPNIQRIINASKEDIDKLAYLLKTDKMDKTTASTISDCLLQKSFARLNPKIINIYSIIITYITEGNNEKINQLINCIVDSFTSDQAKSILENENIAQLVNKYEIETDELSNYNSSIKLLLEKIVFDIIYENNIKKIEHLKNSLHHITNEYVKNERKKYVRKKLLNIDNELNLISRPNKEKQFKLILTNFSIEEVMNLFSQLDTNNCNDDIINLINNKDLLKKCIEFKKGNRTLNVKTYIGIFNKLMTEAYNQKLFVGICDDESIMEKDYSDSFDYYDILAHCNMTVLKEKLLSNEDLMKELKNIIEKYKLFSWNNTFTSLLSDCEYEFNGESKANILNYAYKLLFNIKQVRNNNLLINILDEAMYYTSVSDEYSSLFGKEDYKHLSENKGPNSAPVAKKEERMKLGLSYYKYSYLREKIPVPAIDKEYELNNKKKIKVVLGDTANPINLTLGERTGACMRIRGAGERLFTTCLLNDRAFHIKLYDPKTGKFLSRVSGFRTGNCVFLNSLRSPCVEGFDNSDLYETMKMVSEQIIESTKDSEYPVENVTINDTYAMGQYRNQNISFETNITKDIDIYFDTSTQGIVLATTNKDPNRKMTPIRFSENIPFYHTLRMNPTINYDSKQAYEAIQHVRSIEKMMLDIFGYKEEIDTKINMSITGEDWYIYIDELNNLHYKVIEGISEERKKVATEEMQKYLDRLKLMENIEKKEMSI